MTRFFIAVLGLTLAAFLTVPAANAADISGQWDWINHTEGGDRPASPTFQQSGETITGKWDAADVKGTFSGNVLKLSFPFSSPEGNLSGTLKLDGKLEGEVLKGTWSFDQYSGTFTATRQKTAAANITGSWHCEIQTDRTLDAVLTLTGEGGALAGKIKSQDREIAIASPKFENGVLTFQVEAGSTTVAFLLKQDGDKIEGTWKADGNSGPVKGKRA